MTNIKDNRLIDGIVVKKRIIAEIKQYAENFTKMPCLVSILIGDVPEAAVYVRNQARGAEQAGMPFKQVNWPSDITQDECKARILALNDDATVLGIILQRPVPDHINVRSLQSAIHPLKDVEGMNPASIGNIVYSDVALAPCTAAASVALIKETGLKLEGLEVVMIGHSEIVGKPIAMMLMAEGCTVTVCHHMTRSVAMHSRRADVVVVAVGKAPRQGLAQVVNVSFALRPLQNKTNGCASSALCKHTSTARKNGAQNMVRTVAHNARQPKWMS